MTITAQDVKNLRDETGAGMMDAKAALKESKGDVTKAQEILRVKGQAKAEKKASRTAKEGWIGSYVHGNGKIGVLVEVNAETDFVAKNEDFQKMVNEIAMHIAAAGPRWLSEDQIPEDELAKEKDLFMKEAQEEGKPAKVAKKIVEGKLTKFIEENTLLSQAYVRDPDKTIQDLITDAVAKIGENISIARFERFVLGEE
ncbi:translation elongation factor Ts [Patescibacteria group bacterium]